MTVHYELWMLGAPSWRWMHHVYVGSSPYHHTTLPRRVEEP